MTARASRRSARSPRARRLRSRSRRRSRLPVTATVAARAGRRTRTGPFGSTAGAMTATFAVERRLVACGRRKPERHDPARGSVAGRRRRTAVQAVGQAASSFQLAAATSLAAQLGAKNVNAPVGIKSPGGGGSVSQWNGVGSSAHAGNLHGAKQIVGQHQGGDLQVRRHVADAGGRAGVEVGAARVRPLDRTPARSGATTRPRPPSEGVEGRLVEGRLVEGRLDPPGQPRGRRRGCAERWSRGSVHGPGALGGDTWI